MRTDLQPTSNQEFELVAPSKTLQAKAILTSRGPDSICRQQPRDLSDDSKERRTEARFLHQRAVRWPPAELPHQANPQDSPSWLADQAYGTCKRFRAAHRELQQRRLQSESE